MSFRIGGLFEGCGGLTMGVQAALGGGELAWYSEIEPGPCRLLAHHHPGVPNLGDITAVDWSQVEPVDVICGGSPCQDVSSAGRRAGMRPGTRSGLWESMREAVAVLRPALVVWENVRGVTSAVLGDLADLGYDAQWHGLRAADVGAPHRRFRIFVGAHPQGQPWRIGHRDSGDASNAEGAGRRRSGPDAGQGEHGAAHGSIDCGGIVADTSGDGWDEGRTEPTGLIGRPDVAERGAGVAADTDDDAGHRQRARPESWPGGASGVQWGPYEPAIRRWERVLRRVAPAPTEATSRGGQRLAPRFVEWMQGLPDGHVTDPVLGLTRNEMLKMLGNGAVPQQTTAAVRVCSRRAAALAGAA